MDNVFSCILWSRLWILRRPGICSIRDGSLVTIVWWTRDHMLYILPCISFSFVHDQQSIWLLSDMDHSIELTQNERKWLLRSAPVGVFYWLNLADSRLFLTWKWSWIKISKWQFHPRLSHEIVCRELTDLPCRLWFGITNWVIKR